MRLARQLEASQHLVLGFVGARRRLLVVCFRGVGTGQTMGAKGLKFDGISSRRRRHVDQLTRKIEVSVVVDSGFGDDKTALAGPNLAPSHLERFHHAVHPPSTMTFWPVT